jgi:CHAT domain-containing protein/Tfp pilus assembly protein PilF
MEGNQTLDRTGTGPRLRRALAGVLLAAVVGGCAVGDRAMETVAEETLAETSPLVEAGELQQAVDAYDAALEDHPDNAVLLGERALLLAELGRREAALDGLRAAASAAATAGRADLAGDWGEALAARAVRMPASLDERLAAAESLPDDQGTWDALEFWDALRTETNAAAQSGDMLLAQDLAEQALGLAEDSFGPEHRYAIDSAVDLANVYYASGDATGAETVLMLAIERADAAYGRGHPETLAIRRMLADLYDSMGRSGDALAVIEEAWSGVDDVLPVGAPARTQLVEDLARRRESAGDYAGAATLLEGACADLRERFGTWHARTAGCLEQYGILLVRGGDLDGGRDVFEEVLEIRTGVLGPDAEPTLRTRSDLAGIARQRGDYEAALAELETLEDDVRDALGRGTDLLTDVREARARVLFDLGRVDPAARLAESVHDERLEALGADHPLTLDALNLVGAVHLRAGDFVAAEDAWTGVLAGYREIYGERNLATVTAMANLGLVLENQGLYDQAEPLLRDAVAISEELLGPGHPQTLTSMNNLALLHESQGQFDRAEPLYLLPLEVLTSTLGEQHPRTISVMNNLAFLYMMEERHDRARELFAQVHAAFAEAVGAEHQDTLKALNNLGRVQRRLGELDAAEATIEEALAARRRSLGERHVDAQRSMRDLGVVYFEQGRLEEAEDLLEETLELNTETLGPQHPYTFETLNSLADVRSARGRTEAAFELRRTGFERRTRFFDRVLWVTSDNAREGYVRLHQGERDAYLTTLLALDDARAGREALEVSLQRKGLLLKVASEIRQVAALGLDPELARLTEELEIAREELAALTLAGPAGGDPEAHLERIRDLEFRVDDLQGELGRASVRYRQSITGIGVEDLADELPEDAALVDYLIFDDAEGTRRLTASIMVRDGAGEPRTTIVRYDDLEEVEALVAEYREIIQDEAAGDDEVAEIANIAWEAIWEPLVEHLPEDGAVYLVPDGLLHILPFDALVDGDDEWLIDTTDLHVLSSARDLLPSRLPQAEGAFVVMAGPDYDTEEVAGPQVLAQARGRRAARRSAQTGEPMEETLEELPTVGGEDGDGASGESGTRGSRAGRFEAMRGLSLADLDSRASVELATLRAAASGLRGLSFAPLPGAELEGNLIARQVDGETDEGAVVYSRGEAEEAVLGGIETPPRVLHVATHGFFLEPNEELRQRLLKAQRSMDAVAPPPGDNPLLRAGLAFAGINSNAPFLGEIDTTNDGVLTALEVLSLDLTGTELAVLSACETGLGEIHEGEGVYGLRRAFQEAGVQEVVTSLWEVSDAGTQALMTAMYDRILEGATPREALRDAQRELKDSPRWGYPYVWAAFMIVGR